MNNLDKDDMKKDIYLKKDSTKKVSKLVSFDFLVEEYRRNRILEGPIVFENEEFVWDTYRDKFGYVGTKSRKLIQNVIKKKGYTTKDKVLKYYYTKIKADINVKQLKELLNKLEDSTKIYVNDCEWGISSIGSIELDEENNRLVINI